MTAKQMIALAYCGITQAELARRLGWSPQALGKRMKTGKFTVEEWSKIATALGGSAVIGIKFEGGYELHA